MPVDGSYACREPSRGSFVITGGDMACDLLPWSRLADPRSYYYTPSHPGEGRAVRPLRCASARETWMAGTSPAMTESPAHADNGISSNTRACFAASARSPRRKARRTRSSLRASSSDIVGDQLSSSCSSSISTWAAYRPSWISSVLRRLTVASFSELREVLVPPTPAVVLATRSLLIAFSPPQK